MTQSWADAASPDGLAQRVALALLLCARVAPIAWLVPWASVRGAPAVLPLLVSCVLAVCLWPVACSATPLLPLALASLVALAVREALLGLVYAFALSLPLYALQWSGALAGRAALAPGTDAGYATLQRALGVATFFTLGGHRIAIAALADTLVQRPLGALTRFANPSALALGSARLVADAFASAVLLALPVLAALMLAEWIVALAARTASVPALAAAWFPARGALGALMVWLTAMLWLAAAPDTLRAWFAASKRFWDTL